MYGAPRYYSPVTATLVKDYVYCPVIPWIRVVLGVREPPTPSMRAGRIPGAGLRRVASSLGLPRPWRVEVPVSLEDPPVSGRIDIVAGDGEITVVEVKRFPRSPSRSRHYLAQLAVYTYLAERSLGPVREAILYTPGWVHRATDTRGLIRMAEELISRARAAIGSEEPPQARAWPGKCSYCHYRRFCPRAPSIV